MNRLAKILLAAGFVTFAVAGTALAHGGGGECHGMRGAGLPPPMMMTLRAANLTTAQQDQVHKIMEESRTQARPLREKLRGIHEEISDKLLSSGQVSEKDLEPLQKQEADIRAQLDSNMMATALKVRAVLTPAQIAKMAETHQKLRDIHKQIESLMGPPQKGGHMMGDMMGPM